MGPRAARHDWLCPEIICRQAEKRADILVAPTFNIGMAQHHLGFAGTISLRRPRLSRPSSTGRARWRATVSKILFLNGHGGNIASIEAAFSEIYAEASCRPSPALR
jgi:creatinine amidohydrolase